MHVVSEVLVSIPAVTARTLLDGSRKIRPRKRMCHPRYCAYPGFPNRPVYVGNVNAMRLAGAVIRRIKLLPSILSKFRVASYHIHIAYTFLKHGLKPVNAITHRNYHRNYHYITIIIIIPSSLSSSSSQLS